MYSMDHHPSSPFSSPAFPTFDSFRHSDLFSDDEFTFFSSDMLEEMRQVNEELLRRGRPPPTTTRPSPYPANVNGSNAGPSRRFSDGGGSDKGRRIPIGSPPRTSRAKIIPVGSPPRPSANSFPTYERSEPGRRATMSGPSPAEQNASRSVRIPVFAGTSSTSTWPRPPFEDFGASERVFNFHPPLETFSDWRSNTHHQSSSNDTRQTRYSYENAHRRQRDIPVSSFADDTLFLSTPSASPVSSFGGSWSSPPRSTTQPSKRDKLLSALTQNGIAYTDLPGMGNCLFESLADQLLGDASQHPSLRRMIIDEIRSHPDTYGPDIWAQTRKTTEAPFDYTAIVRAYCDEMAKDGVAGDAVCIAAFAKCFGCDVGVYLVDEEGRRVGGKGMKAGLVCIKVQAGETPAKKGERGTVWLAWVPSESGVDEANHYCSVYPPPNFCDM
ncbi:hypothetical protein BJ742DRAFT_820353 [Cladochytrium replicatum]|nr:hypothetical protein BJ742DRAFT_820353 [Cladochytrium replicatum]